MTEKEFAARVEVKGGRAYIVGGWVRDFLRHCPPQDKDYVIIGLSAEETAGLFPEAKIIGGAFPVFLMHIEGKKCEVALARKERKSGRGYRGFIATADGKVTLEEDLYRRDLTINGMALDVLTREITDPYGGRQDLANKILRPISLHFQEDPVRALRGARFAAQLEFQATPELLQAMAQCRSDLQGEPPERLWGEMKKALAARRPSLFFRTLEQAGLLADTFPELHDLIGKTQPEFYHPEGDAFEHTMEILEKVSAQTENIVARFAALVHDLGKGTTPRDMLPHHYGHEMRGKAVLDRWNKRMTLPHDWLKAGYFVIRQHMRAARLGKAGKIAAFLLDMEKQASVLSIEELNIIFAADNKGLPLYLQHGREILSAMHQVTGKDAPADMAREKIGEWLFSQQVHICSKWLGANNASQ